MPRLLGFGFTNNRLVLIGVVFFTTLSALFVGNIRVDLTTETLIAPESELRRDYERVRETFGSDQVALVYAQSENLFSPDKLKALRELNDQLSKLPFVEKVDSLYTLPDIRDVDGFLDPSPLLSEMPDDPEALRKKQDLAVDNPLLIRNVVSEDGRAMVLTLYLDPALYNQLGARAVHDELQALIEPYSELFDELFQLGNPSLTTWMLDALAFDMTVILPFAGIMLLILLIINLKSFVAGLIPIINAGLATMWTLAAMAWLDLPLNLLNYILPALILVIGATEDVHIIDEFRSHLKNGISPEKAILNSSKQVGLALLLTGITTILGFAATGISNLPVLRIFGIASVIGISLRFLISLLILPAELRLVSRFFKPTTAARLISDAQAVVVSDAVVKKLAPKLPVIAIVLVGVAGMAVLNGLNIRLSNDLVSFLDEESTVRTRMDQVAENLSGSKLIYLTLYEREDSFLEPKSLNRLQDITAYLESLEGIDSAMSFADIIARTNEQLREGDPAFNRIPDTTSAVRQMLLFTHGSDFKVYMTPDYSKANIVIRSNLHDSDAVNALVRQIEGELEANRFGPIEFTITGSTVLVASPVSSIVKAQIASLGGMTLLLFCIVSILFISFRCGAITVLANLFSISLIFGIMGLVGISLNIGTCMVAAITLGIAIDDTLHILVRFNRELKIRKNESEAIHESLRHEMNPILATSLALAGGFLVLAFSSFEPVRQFGVLSATVIILALGTDLIVTPVLFATTRLVTLWDILGLSLQKTLIEKSPVFRDFTRWQAKKFILLSQIEEYAAGTRFIKEGEIGNNMYVIIEGEVKVSIDREGVTIPIADRGLGDVIGEVGLITHDARSADITAISKTRVLSIDTESMDSLRRFSPFLASRLFLNLANILGNRLATRLKETKSPFEKD